MEKENRPGKTSKAPALAVIGAGPGGLHAAIAAARRGMKVVLFEKGDVGDRIVCGECIFDSLGMLPPPDAGRLYEVRTILISARGAYRLPIGNYRRLWMVDRRTWQRQLAAQAAVLGVDVRCGEKITPAGVGELVSRYDWVIDASGAPSVTSRAYGFAGEYRRRPPLLAYQYTVAGDFSALFSAATIKVGFLSRAPAECLPGYYWIFPKSSGVANVGVVFTRGGEDGFSLDLKGLLTEIMGRESLHPERVLRKGGGLIPTCMLPRLVYGRIVLVGDAAGLTSPLHGGGIDLAWLSGVRAVEAISKGKHGVGSYRRGLLSLMKHKLSLEEMVIAKMKTLPFTDFDDLLHAAAVHRAGIRTKVGLRHPGLLAAAWLWLKARRPPAVIAYETHMTIRRHNGDEK